MELIQSAFFWGIVSAVSLPLGAWIGLMLRPGRKVTSALMAFGAGSLLFALTIELFAKTLHQVAEHGNRTVLLTMAGAVAGGLLFDLLNQILNNRGAFLRRVAVARRHLTRLKRLSARQLLHQLSRITLLQSLPPRDIVRLLPHLKRRSYEPGSTIFTQGDDAEALYFIVDGEVEIVREGTDTVAVLGAHDTFGEMALLSDTRRSATARARTRTRVLQVLYADFERLLTESVELREAVRELVAGRVDDLARKAPGYEADRWKDESLKHLEHLSLEVSEAEIEEAGYSAHAGGGAALAIWLGIGLDGIPESLIIGMLAAGTGGMSLAFIAGVFLANLPEAMSSAVGMRAGGMSAPKIFWMWTSLCLMTGLGAALGVLLFPEHPAGGHYALVYVIEGLAAGAMLTMIAETMLPEAYEHGGAIVGFSTLLGFLTALLIKIL